MRIFAVTGTWACETAARTMSAASAGCSMRAEPSPLVMTLRAGHAMLMSMSASLSPTRSSTASTASANWSGLLPKSCTAMLGSSSAGSTSSQVCSLA